MVSKLIRLVGLGTVGALVIMWARAIAHSKVPPPEGEWREIDLERPPEP